ncbi:dihydrolipoyl dehydrogenase, partial [Xylella fastidiosa subsp. multiplex]|nr:dihydrolipoyl dehydrogenase [Xylella fastidiosa subsp. multiplex]
MIEIKVPDIGDYSKVPVIEVLVTVGDHVVKNQGILTLESDKATLEVPSMNNGVVKELKVNVGDLLSQGDVILLLETEDTTAPPSPSNAATSDTTSP